MHILIAGEYPHDEMFIKGGVANVVFSLVEEMKNIENIKVTVLSTTQKKSKSYMLSANINIVFINVINLPLTLNTFLFQAWGIKNEIIKIKPDIVHAHNMSGFAVGAVNSGYPCLITCHGDWMSDQARNRGKSVLKTKIKVYIWAKIYTYIFNRAKYFTSISPYVKNLILSFNSVAKIFSINNPLSKQYYININKVTERKSILWAGRVCPQKRLDIAVEVFIMLKEKFPELLFEIAGEPENDGLKEYIEIKKLATKDLENRVIFHGNLSRSEMIKCYDRAKVLIFTSEQEASPLVIIEAMARGVAIVCSDLPGIEHLIIDGINGFKIKNFLPRNFFQKISKLIEDDSLYKQFVQKGFEKSSMFSADIIVKENLKAYKEILLNLPNSGYC